MSNSYFQFKQFTIHQDRCAMKVTTDGCLFGAWVAKKVSAMELMKPANPESQGPLVLDIGTGTGLLSLMLIQKNPSFEINAMEIDMEAAQQAEDNFLRSPWPDSFYVIPDDARSFVFNYEYDVIICNPPFYENELKSDDKKKNTAHHSDELSIADLLTIIKENLYANGTFYLLLPYKRNEEIKKLITANDLFIEEIVLVRQSVKHDHFRIMLAGKLKANDMNETAINEIAIRNGEEYTDDFKNLLKDYYLHL